MFGLVGAANAAPTMVAAGWNCHTFAIDTKGILRIWGCLDFWNGFGAVDFQAVPTSVPDLPEVTAVSAGLEHTAILKQDGSVWTWGKNTYGQLGNGYVSSSPRTAPAQVAGLSNITAIAAGITHTVALSQDGSVWFWGQLGMGLQGMPQFRKPTQVSGLTDVVAVATKTDHVLALKSDGTVWAWGSNASGEIGDGSDVTVRDSPTPIPGLSGIAGIAAGDGYSFAIGKDGSVKAWGYNSYGMLGDGTQVSRPTPVTIDALAGVKEIAPGNEHVIALKPDGTVLAWGTNFFGALGDGTRVDRLTPAAVPMLTGVNQIESGSDYSVAITTDGFVWTWGNNTGKLGDGTFAGRLRPVLVVNETANGLLDLRPEIDHQSPPSARVPFFLVASGNVSGINASVSTTTKFNAPDVGKSGAVYVTARAAAGSMRALSAGTVQAGDTLGTYGAWSALTAADAFELMQLTPSGWQPVVNGQLLPYASGVIGDQIAAQTILDGMDTTNLKNAQFCVGYGTSADEMIAAGRMRVVATITDPFETGATTTSCIVEGSTTPLNYLLNLPSGWNLIGNSLDQTLSVASLYSDANAITSVWKWDTGISGWQFYTPLMDAAALQSYAAGKGYGVLSAINPGEGYWVNVKARPSPTNYAGASFNLTAANLTNGWNLVATGHEVTPATFNQALGTTPLVSLWAWDNPKSAWYFYAPSLYAQGGTALTDYITSKGYLDFTTANKMLGNGTGFWVNKP